MKHQEQGQWECWPTTLAMLAGVNKDRVIDELESILRMSYSAALSQGEMDPVRREEIVRICTRVAKKFNQTWIPAEWTSELFPYGAHQLPDELPSGRGVITIAQRGVGAHIVAYEDGMVYDPDLPHPMSVQEWKARRRDWALRSLTPEEKKK